MTRRKTAVFVALSETVGHDLVFMHYTNKVVVGKYSKTKMTRVDEPMLKKKKFRA